MAPRSVLLRWEDPIQGHPDWDDPDEVAVWVSVSKLDEAWKFDHEFYICAGGSGASIDTRYEDVGTWLASAPSRIELPVVGIEDGVVSFATALHGLGTTECKPCLCRFHPSRLRNFRRGLARPSGNL